MAPGQMQRAITELEGYDSWDLMQLYQKLKMMRPTSNVLQNGISKLYMFDAVLYCMWQDAAVECTGNQRCLECQSRRCKCMRTTVNGLLAYEEHEGKVVFIRAATTKCLHCIRSRKACWLSDTNGKLKFGTNGWKEGMPKAHLISKHFPRRQGLEPSQHNLPILMYQLADVERYITSLRDNIVKVCQAGRSGLMLQAEQDAKQPGFFIELGHQVAPENHDHTGTEPLEAEDHKVPPELLVILHELRTSSTLAIEAAHFGTLLEREASLLYTSRVAQAFLDFHQQLVDDDVDEQE